MNTRQITPTPSFLSSVTGGVAVLLGACLLGQSVLAQSPQMAPLNPAFEAYVAAVNSGQPATGGEAANYYGLVPAPMDLSYLRAQAQAQPPGPPHQGYDPRYDLRTLGRVTPVRNQNPYGTCWSFGTYGSLESCLLPSETCDFSENNLVNLAGFDWGFNSGGNAFMSMAYLARWAGPVSETDDRYPNPGGSPAGLTVRKHVQQVRLIPPKAGPTYNDEIKQALMDYGAIDASYYHDDYYYHSGYHSYYCPSASQGNHAVTLVGWDDNYSSSKFVFTPPGNGAYIVKNSWGTAWGESGYFYVSYYDAVFANEAMYAFLNAESTNNYARQYSYDKLGWVSAVGYGNNTCWGANIFTASASENLSAVAFYANSVNTSYALEVRTGVAAGSPRSGVLASSQSGTCSYPGYRTLSLNTPVALTAGQRFSIVLQLTTPGYSYPQPMESVISGYSSGATASPGQSYLSYSGSTWDDLTTYYPNANLCIKGFTAAGATNRAVPVITQDPQAVTVTNGSSVIFTVIADGLLPLSYQWQKNGTNLMDGSNISGATSNLLSLSFTSLGDAGAYTVVITNSAGSITSAAATLTILAPPSILASPQSQTVKSGSNVVFNVMVTGYPPPTFQWSFNGTNLPGGTTSSLLLNNVQMEAAGDYAVAVSNSLGFAVSAAATLVVLTSPEIVRQPQGLTAYWGCGASFSVKMKGSPPFSYQWYFEDFPIPWGTNSNLDLTNLEPSDGGEYWVEVSNDYGSVTSDSATLIVNPAGVSLGTYPGLTINGAVGKTFGIQYVTDIGTTNNWQTIATLTLTQPVQLWVDTNANISAGAPKRFYRVVAIP